MRRAQIRIDDPLPSALALAAICSTVQSLLLLVFAGMLLVAGGWCCMSGNCVTGPMPRLCLYSALFAASVGIVMLIAWLVDCPEPIEPPKLNRQFSLRSLLATCGFLAAFMPFATMEWTFLTASLVSAQTALVIGVLYFVEGWITRRK